MPLRFQRLLANQLKRRRSTEEINTLHIQASAWFFDNDLVEEGFQHALASGNMEIAGSLVARVGHQLMNDQQWSRLERCLHLLPRDKVERDPALLVLEAWLQHVRQNGSGIVPGACPGRAGRFHTPSRGPGISNGRSAQTVDREKRCR